MKPLTLLAAFLFSTPIFAADVPSPPTQLCVDESCSSTSSSAGYQFPSGPVTPSAAPLTAVSTFHNVSLYWNEATGSNTNEALVRFRKAGSNTWRQGLSLWFDVRSSGSGAGQVPYGFKEYRGSLVQLDSNSTYEVEVLTTGSRRLASTQISTWNEVFPVGATVTLPTNSSSTLNINQSGTPNGYRLYTHASGGSATIDGNNAIDNAVVISGSYVILRGLTLRETQRSNILITNTAHHVVIEQNDLSKFGRADPLMPQFGCNGDYGIGTEERDWPRNANVAQVVIQNNRIHHPNMDTNSWEEQRLPSLNCGPVKDLLHPAGPGAISFFDTGGNHVIRYNQIYSDLEHMFDDGIGGGQNFSVFGPYSRDSDIYGNSLSHIWDDAIESEGANMNVRIYENHVELSMISIAAATVSIGPLYIYRNVATKGIRGPDSLGGEGWFVKSRNKSIDGTIAGINMGGGRVYLFHNTAYRTGTADAVKAILNVDEISLVNIVSRNNTWNSNSAPGSTKFPMSESDFDFDMYTAGHTAWDQEQANGIEANPVYDSGHSSGKYTLTTGKPGHDAGVVIPNFNDEYADSAPDVGAQERGREALRFGVR